MTRVPNAGWSKAKSRRVASRLFERAYRIRVSGGKAISFSSDDFKLCASCDLYFSDFGNPPFSKPAYYQGLEVTYER